MNKAIKRAIEGGYVISSKPQRGRFKFTKALQSRVHEILLDPLFWQALGKAEGWGEVIKGSVEQEGTRFHSKKWKAHWHDFIDHIAEGRDVDSFFTEILK